MTCISLGLIGCSGLLSKLPLPDKPTVDAELVIGDKEEAVLGQLGDESKVETGDVEGGINTTTTTYIENNVSYVMLLLAILGWVLPTPRSMFSGFIGLFKKKDKREDFLL